MSKKYRQPGYQDNEGRDKKSRSGGRRRGRGEGPRSPQMTGFHNVIRCSACGATLPPSFSEITSGSRCPKCEADLHSCRNCVFFDPASRFQCTQPVSERIARKDAGNSCEYFEIRTRVEKETTSSAPQPVDPREAFERLFKK